MNETDSESVGDGNRGERRRASCNCWPRAPLTGQHVKTWSLVVQLTQKTSEAEQGQARFARAEGKKTTRAAVEGKPTDGTTGRGWGEVGREPFAGLKWRCLFPKVGRPFVQPRPPPPPHLRNGKRSDHLSHFVPRPDSSPLAVLGLTDGRNMTGKWTSYAQLLLFVLVCTCQKRLNTAT